METSRTQFEVLGLGLEGQILGFELASPRENALFSAREQQCFLTCWKWAKVMTNFVSFWRTPESLRKKFWRHFFSWRTLKIYDFLERKLFVFFWKKPEVFGKFTKRFFFGDHSALCPWSLASRGFVLGRAVLGRGFFLCLWPRALCLSTLPLMVQFSNVRKAFLLRFRGKIIVIILSLLGRRQSKLVRKKSEKLPKLFHPWFHIEIFETNTF